MKVTMTNGKAKEIQAKALNGTTYVSHQDLKNAMFEDGVEFDFPHVGTVGDDVYTMCVVCAPSGVRRFGTGQAPTMVQAVNLALDNALIDLYKINAQSCVEVEIAQAAKKAAEEAAVVVKKAADEAEKQKAAEEAAAKKKAAEEAAVAKKAAEEAARKKAEEEALAAKKAAEEEAARKAAEEEAKRKAAEEEAAKKKAAEEAARKKAEEEAARKAAEEAAKKAAEEAAARKAAEEEAKKKAAEEAARKKAEEEAAAKKKAEAEAAKKAAEEEAARKKAAEEEAAKRAAEEAARKAEEEAAAKKIAPAKAQQGTTPDAVGSYSYANDPDWVGCRSLTPDDPSDVVIDYGPFKPNADPNVRKPGPRYLSQVLKFRSDFIEKLIELQPPAYIPRIPQILTYCANQNIGLHAIGDKARATLAQYGVREL